MQLKELSLRNSRWIWNSLRAARTNGYQIGEESITDFLILNLKRWGKGQIVVDTFTKRREAMNGADWEWWFTGSSGRWLGMRVQAKIVNLKSQKYEHLHAKNRYGQQVDILIADANRNHVVPLYCMYTNWHPGDYVPRWRCQDYRHSTRNYGAAVLDPRVVQDLKSDQRNDLGSVIGHLRPLHCLFCCPRYSQGDLPERAEKWLECTGLLPKKEGLAEPQSGDFLTYQPPSYVERLVAKDLVDSADELADERLARVTVFRELAHTD